MAGASAHDEPAHQPGQDVRAAYGDQLPVRVNVVAVTSGEALRGQPGQAEADHEADLDRRGQELRHKAQLENAQDKKHEPGADRQPRGQRDEPLRVA